ARLTRKHYLPRGKSFEFFICKRGASREPFIFLFAYQTFLFKNFPMCHRSRRTAKIRHGIIVRFLMVEIAFNEYSVVPTVVLYQRLRDNVVDIIFIILIFSGA